MLTSAESFESACLIRPLLCSPSAEVRSTAVAALGKLHAHEAARDVVLVLRNDGADEVRASAADTLAVIASVDTSEVLVAALEDKSPKVRFVAARALGRLRFVSARFPLRSVVEDDPDARTRAHAARAIGSMGVQEDKDFLAARARLETEPEVIAAIEAARATLALGLRGLGF